MNGWNNVVLDIQSNKVAAGASACESSSLTYSPLGRDTLKSPLPFGERDRVRGHETE